LLARRAICNLLQSSGREDEFRRAVEALAADFVSTRWILDRALWGLTAAELERWTGPLPVSVERKALTAAAEWFWQNARAGNLPAAGRRNLLLETNPVTLLWRAEGQPGESSQWKATAVTAAVVGSWLDIALRTTTPRSGRSSLLTETGDLFYGDAPDSRGATVRRNASETGLPWTVALSATDESRLAASLTARRRLLGSGLAAIVLLLAGGSYFLWRVIARELAMARLQADFVATVSHEFRTPLTTLRHITELLEEDDGSARAGDERKTFYAALGRNTERLHRLVESLLDFSRMETGKKPWRREAMDVGALVTKTAMEFEQEVAARGVRVDLVVDQPDELLLKADGDALGHALWNLLDNAVKYSPDCKVVQVHVSRDARAITIAVKDEGLGVPAREQRQIFDRFVRGQKAGELGIKGTGLGLAIVSHIVAAHGGEIELESVEGKGSTFRMVLPAAN
jgi:signal transduction histidine kinase